MDRPEKNRNRVTPEGRTMGEQMARLTDASIAKLVAEGESDERCKSCAFRAGTVPNGCPQTQLDALKCVVEDVPFLCHQADRKNWPCHGWYAARVTINRAEKIRGTPLPVAKCPWDFSAPDEPDEPHVECLPGTACHLSTDGKPCRAGECGNGERNGL